MIRKSTAIVVAAAGLIASLPGSGLAAQVIGQTGPADACVANMAYTQDALVSGPGYSPSAHGVITSWSSVASAEPNHTLKLFVLRPDAPANHFTAVEKDQVRTLTMAGVLNTFTELRLPIEPNERLGLYVPIPQPFAGNGYCGFIGTGADATRFTMGFGEPGLNASTDYPQTTPAGVPRRINASALVEPDADRDNFGDETQDLCASQTATQGACANAFSLNVQGGKKGAVTLTATVPGGGTLSAAGASGKSLAARAAKKKKKKPLLEPATASRSETVPGDLKLGLKPTKKARKLLRGKGKLRTKLTVTFTPTGGAPAFQTVKVKLEK